MPASGNPWRHLRFRNPDKIVRHQLRSSWLASPTHLKGKFQRLPQRRVARGPQLPGMAAAGGEKVTKRPIRSPTQHRGCFSSSALALDPPWIFSGPSTSGWAEQKTFKISNEISLTFYNCTSGSFSALSTPLFKDSFLRSKYQYY